MIELLVAAGVFVFSHLLPMHPSWRGRLEQRLGERGFLLGYSLLSLAVLAWLGHAFASAPYVLLWPWHPATAWVPVLVMPFACILLVAGLSSSNPFSLGLGAQGYDPGRPGIVSLTRHPVMWALALWAGSHMPANGDLAAVVLFGLLLLLSLTGTRTIEGNRRRRFRVEQWAVWREGTGNWPSIASVDWSGIGPARIGGGLVLYGLLLALHSRLVGPDPLAVLGG
ncbi:NnrU family protein [Motiliproteus sp. SC1-56]|uniref:NnrU family protein n=1 Tax=Motiliproteus sp. SC1-56 TaxID=2799565 RepID=UPI001A8F9292|nr:NnrU family protein [Motiliproteus sp. SC1-56]